MNTESEASAVCSPAREIYVRERASQQGDKKDTQPECQSPKRKTEPRDPRGS